MLYRALDAGLLSRPELQPARVPRDSLSGLGVCVSDCGPQRRGSRPGWTTQPSPRTLLGEEVIERLHGREFVVLDVKNGIELRDVENVVHFLGEVHKLELPTILLHRNKAADQLSDPRTVDVADFGKVEQDFLFLLADEPCHRLAQLRSLIPKNDAPTNVEDGDMMAFATGDLQAQFSSVSWR
jgi:hypothetical protein